MSIIRRNIGPFTNFIPPTKRPMAPSPDVVLSQGFFTSPQSLQMTVNHLENNGLNCSFPSLGGLKGIWQTARVAHAGTALAAYLGGLPGDAQPWLVGHSIGGMIARYAVQVAGAADRVQGVITIGAPHRGTPTAIAGLALGLGLLSRAPFDITPISPLVRKLNELPWPESTPLISIISRSDVLCPGSFGEVRFSESQGLRTIALEGLGHTEMVRTPWVLDGLVGLMSDPATEFVPR